VGQIIKILQLLLFALLILALIIPESYLILSITLSITLFMYFIFLFGKQDVILEFIVLMAIVQWLISPIISYEVFEKIPLMAVDARSYFDIILPSSILFSIAALYPFSKRKIIWNKNPKVLFVTTLVITLGFINYVSFPYLPGAFKNLAVNFNYLILIGFFYIFFVVEKYKIIATLLVLTYFLINAAKSGMFADILVWGFFFFNLYFQKKNYSFLFKLSFITISMLFFMPIQSLKQEYRQVIWHQNNKEGVNKIQLVTSLYMDYMLNPKKIMSSGSLSSYNGRLNQGAIISKTIEHVPKSEAFANGETIVRAIKASILPRLLNPSKPKIGGRHMYPRFTGHKLLGKTSANISPMGEAYVNFGPLGGAVFMFCFGLFLNFAISFCFIIAKKRSNFIFWIPLLFNSALFLGRDMHSILNSMSKTLFFIFFLYWGFRIVFKIKLF